MISFKQLPNYAKKGYKYASNRAEVAVGKIHKRFEESGVGKKETYNLGVLPAINASVINFLFFGLGLIVLSIDKASHLILSNLGYFDPFTSTLLIFFYCLVCLYIFEKKKYRIEKAIRREAENHEHETVKDPFPKVFGSINYYGLIPLPLILWFLYLSYQAITANNHIEYSSSISLFGSACLILLLWFFGSKFQSQKWRSASIIHVEDINNNRPTFTSTTVRFRLFFLFFIILIIHIMVYEIFGRDLHYKSSLERFFERMHLWRLAIQVPLFLIAIYFYLDIIKLDLKQLKSLGSKWTKWPGLKIIFFLLVSLPLLYVGTLRPLDVLVTYFIGLRLFVYGYGHMFSWIFERGLFDVPLNFDIYKKILWVGMTLLLLAIMLWAPVKYISGTYNTTKQFTYVKNTDTFTPLAFNDYVHDWLEKGKTKTTPIYLVAGQGGGSRAGCAFFTTMMNMDSTFGDDLLAMTTISGSSNGAGFYLGYKASFDTLLTAADSALAYSKILYNKDYITSALFKMLVVDPIFNMMFPDFDRKNRNDFIISSEADSFDSLHIGSNNIFLKNWNEVYNDSIMKNHKLPIFIPVTYNINKARPAISSPLRFNGAELHGYHQIIDTSSQLTIGQSISLSEMFPLVSASATIDGDNYMDGGVYDNTASEMLLHLYKITSSLRNDICSQRPIVMLSIHNGAVFDTVDENSIKSEFSAISASALRSIFISNPLTHVSEINMLVEPSNDKYYPLEVHDLLSDSVGIVMSRYLQDYEIDSISIWSLREINKINLKKLDSVKIFYDFGKTILSSESKHLLDNLKDEFLKADTIKLKSAACSVFEKENNNNISKRLISERTASTKNYLIQQFGIDARKILEEDDFTSIGHKHSIIDRLYDRNTEIVIVRK